MGENYDLKKVTIGNKIDFEGEVNKGETEAFAKENNCAYFETSTKENKGIDEAIMFLVEKLISDKDGENNKVINKQ